MFPRFTFAALIIALLFSACQPMNVSPTAGPTDSQIIDTQSPPPEPDHIAATIQLNSPSNMKWNPKVASHF